VSGDDDIVVGEIKTLVTFVVSGVSKDNIFGGSGCQFVSGFSGEIRIAATTEHAQVFIGGGDSIEGEVWAGCADCLGGEVVQQICGHVEPFYPVVSWNRSLKKQGKQHIINGAKDALDFTVMQRSVGTRHPQKYPFGDEECVRGGVIELTSIVAPDGFDGATKLCGDIIDFFNKVEKVSDLTCKVKVHTKWE
jgi:hypothetical protein